MGDKMKYDIALDMSNPNDPAAVILKQVKPGATVLEFGPANGRMTRYMREEMGCRVYIVEIDEESGRDAAAYAEKAMLGSVDGDIEAYRWAEAFAGVQFDHILFTDVLEHIRDAKKCLSVCREILAPEGSILLSTPNISHNAILIELMNGRFPYRETGLLDNTHIHFFTYQELLELFRQVDLKATRFWPTFVTPLDSEFKVDYAQAPASTRQFLKTRQEGEYYQLIFELKKEGPAVPEHILFKENDQYRARLLIDTGEGFLNAEILHQNVHIENNGMELTFDLPHESRNVRLDPIDTPCTMVIDTIECTDAGGNPVEVKHIANAELSMDATAFFMHKNPEIILRAEKPIARVYARLYIYLADAMKENIKWLNGLEEIGKSVARIYASKPYRLFMAMKKVFEWAGSLRKTLYKLTHRRRHLVRDKVRRIMVLNPYFPTLGGGEKYMAYLCRFLERYYPNARIDLVVHNFLNNDVHDPAYPTVQDMAERFDLELNRTRLLKVPAADEHDFSKAYKTRLSIERRSARYDLFINFMFLSTHIGRAKVNVYECMFPPPLQVDHPFFQGFLKGAKAKYLDWKFREAYDRYIIISEFSRRWMERYWGGSDRYRILYSPVFSVADKSRQYIESEKKNIILSVGRFFTGGHNKKQDVLARIFVTYAREFAGYELHFVGALMDYPEHQQYFTSIRRATEGYPVYFHTNVSSEERDQLYRQTKIFWHATGYEEDMDIDPLKMEHFGITTVEAMSYGAVPVVINRGGQTEIVEAGANGYLWDTEQECAAQTLELIRDDALRKRMAAAAVERAKAFSLEKFDETCEEIFGEL